VDLNAVRQAIAGYLGTTVPALEGHTFVRGSVNPPAIIVTPAPGVFLDYRVTQGQGFGALTYTLRLILLASTADNETGTVTLDAMIALDGPTSIPAALEADPTLGGQVGFAVPTVAQRYGGLTYGGVDYIGCELMVEVGAP
jgi:hypothetical protein